MDFKHQLKRIMKHYNIKTKKQFKEYIKYILHTNELGEIIENDDMLQDLLTIDSKYYNHKALYFTIALDDTYNTRHFVFYDSYQLISVSYLSWFK